MTSIGPADRILIRLREELRAQAKAAGRAGRTRAERTEPRPLERLRQGEWRDGLSDDESRRMLVRAMLTEEFGDALGNEPEFLRIIDNVHRLLSEDKDSREMLDRALDQLRKPPSP